MKKLIVYAGKTGTTEKCAKLLADKLADADLINLNEKSPDPTAYDIIVIGSNIRMGQIHKNAKKYLVQYSGLLKQKLAAYFICCGFSDKQKQVLEANIPKELLDKAVAVKCFGGEIDISRLHGMDKLITKMVTKATADQHIAPPAIQYDRIDEMAAILKQL